MSELITIGQNAKNAKYALAKAETVEKNKVLMDAADALIRRSAEIIEANEKDLQNGRDKGMHQGLLDRLALDEKRIHGIAEGLKQVASLPDPLGEEMEEFTRPNGLVIKKVRVPIGVVGIIYESRPNVTADAFSLCFKTGNVTILKGGSDALHSNVAIVAVLRDVLTENGFDPNVLQLITDTDRSVVTEFMKMDEYVDLLIPRGSAGLIRSCVQNSTIPVIQTGTGNCHIYIDEDADLTKAIPIIINAKTQRIGVCNAAESLVIHRNVLPAFLPEIAKALKPYEVELRGDQESCDVIPEAIPATEEDFGKEYLDYIMSIKTVSGVEEAVDHINRYNTGHSEAIITENKDHAKYFLDNVDAACVYVNASTRFTDGFEFGFGAEIGISTQKLHARGPMGLKELTSYKYEIIGDGQVRD